MTTAPLSLLIGLLAATPAAARPGPGLTACCATPAVAAARRGARSADDGPGKPDPARRVVIIDAGHGGRDSGRLGPRGIKEKTITLQIARRLATVLKARGYEVHLTRNRDTLIALADRPRLANEWKQGRPQTVFVSIHANAGARQATGFETYFLSDARTEDERRVAEMENAAASYEGRTDSTATPGVEHILNSLRNDYYVKASNDLAELIQRRLAKVEPGPDRGVKQAGFRVLVGAIMPAVLVETGFLSNPGEARLLAGARLQQRIAGALADAIGDFFARHAWAAGAGS